MQNSSSFDAMPNPSLKLTRYGRLCKPGLWRMVHHHSPGLCTACRSGQLSSNVRRRREELWKLA